MNISEFLALWKKIDEFKVNYCVFCSRSAEKKKLQVVVFILQNLFQSSDTNRNRYLNKYELKEALSAAGK